ncbi:hypothetical protein [Rhizobium sp. RU36D]|uniref:hypothetical protein n=1 Tax=Rhizobium sp. RU36D TaxID=1907415 RepID=UPI0009D82771|nr:hypothetical protein [Rhizobium sp. RU36D]SMC94193.1 hypothetical protein SAMN05880593_11183 [Rhizobium sp. RU36D]
MTQLSILIPSNRPLKTSIASLESALIYAEKTGAQVIVADNSGDPDKKRHFENASPHLTYIDTDGFDARRNFLTTMETANTPYVLAMGDDDELYSLDGRRRVDLADLPNDVVGVRPVTMVWTVQDGARSIEKFPLDAENADDRIRQLVKAAPRNNSVFYSAFRRELLVSLYRKFNACHPTLGDYCDWVLIYCLIASGRILHEPATLFRYDLGRWAEKSSLEETKLLLFRRAGLPDEAELYTALLRFVDIHGLMTWKGLPLSDEQRHRALAINAQITLTSFAQSVEKNPGIYHEQARRFANQVPSINNLDYAYQSALPVLEQLQPGLAEKYASYLNSMVS